MATQAEIFDNFWLYWLLAFIVIELFALIYSRHVQEKDQDGTLTSLVHRITKQNRLVKAIFILFMIYLTLHFMDVPGFVS